MVKYRRYNGILYTLHKLKTLHYVTVFEMRLGPFTSEELAERQAHRIILDKIDERIPLR